MATSRSDLEKQLALLAAQTPELVRDNPDDADFFPAFAGESDDILDGAGPDDVDWALYEIDKILAANGKLRTDVAPSDDLPPSP
jgi:hypothetical protein